MSRIQVKDGRQHGWFTIYNDVIDIYGPQMGANGLAVYAVLARFADASTREAHPSHERIAELTALSRSSVIRSLNNLRDMGLITIEKQYAKNAGGGRRQLPSLYTLLLPSAAASVSQGHTGQCVKTSVSQGHTNKTHWKKTQQQQSGAEVAAAAGSLTPSQTALRDLLGTYGVTANRSSLDLICTIADKPAVLDVVREKWSEIQAMTPPRKNPPGLLLSILKAHDFDNPAPKAKPKTPANPANGLTGGKKILEWREVNGVMTPVVKKDANT